jgi:hypothetical protein
MNRSHLREPHALGDESLGRDRPISPASNYRIATATSVSIGVIEALEMDDTQASRPRELPLSQSTRKGACAHPTLQAVLRLGCDWLEAPSRDSPATRLPAFPRKRLQTVSPLSQQISL